MSEPGPSSVNDNAPKRRCPICGKPTVAAFRPFCSKRCSNVDLHRWLAGVYAVPGVPEEDAEPAENSRKDGDTGAGT